MISNFEIMPETNLDRALHLVYQSQDLQSGFLLLGEAGLMWQDACLWGVDTLLGNDAGDGGSLREYHMTYYCE